MGSFYCRWHPGRGRALLPDLKLSMILGDSCNDPPRRYDINTLICDNFNFYKKNSLNLLMKIEVILSQHTFTQQHAIT